MVTLQDLESQRPKRLHPQIVCWPDLTWHSYSLRTNDRSVFLRRLCMLLILILRTIVSVISILHSAYGTRIVSVVIGSILSILGFFFIAWCLARIGDMYGERRVLGLLVGRKHFDAFLVLCALVHVGILVGPFVGASAPLVSALWLTTWILIFAVAWVASWDPMPVSLDG